MASAQLGGALTEEQGQSVLCDRLKWSPDVDSNKTGSVRRKLRGYFVQVSERCDASDLHSGGAWFESRLRDVI
jgi:hypothetical protein